MSDEITRSLKNLAGDLPPPRQGLSEAAKDDLVSKIGPLTTRDIVRAKSQIPLSRIPFVFSRLDTQLVVDVLANDMDAAIQRALVARGKK